MSFTQVEWLALRWFWADQATIATRWQDMDWFPDEPEWFKLCQQGLELIEKNSQLSHENCMYHALSWVGRELWRRSTKKHGWGASWFADKYEDWLGIWGDALEHAERLLNIGDIFSHPAGPTIAQIALLLNIPENMVQRYIDDGMVLSVRASDGQMHVSLDEFLVALKGNGSHY